MDLSTVNLSGLEIGFNFYDDPELNLDLNQVSAIIIHDSDCTFFVSIDANEDPQMFGELLENPRTIQSWYSYKRDMDGVQ